MKRAGFVWTPGRLADYLASPQKLVPGNNMPFAGIANPQQRADLVAYLGTLRKPPARRLCGGMPRRRSTPQIIVQCSRNGHLRR
jgi:cytochrome c1